MLGGIVDLPSSAMKLSKPGVDAELTRLPTAHRATQVDKFSKPARDFEPPESVFRAYPQLSRDAFQARGKYMAPSLSSSPPPPPLVSPGPRQAVACLGGLWGCWGSSRGEVRAG
eukprot:5937915-Pyramimonas_sp.AAC.1